MENVNETPVRIPCPSLKPIRELPLYTDLRDLIRGTANEYGDDISYIIKTKRESGGQPAEYRTRSFREVKEDIDLLGTSFLRRGFKGKRLAVVSKNRYEWMLAYYAHLFGLGIVIPLDKDLPYSELKQSLIKAKADILVFDDGHSEMVKILKEDEEIGLETYITMDREDGYENIEDLIEEGRNFPSDREVYENLPVDGKALSIILFTSGTSGMAKAVMLSQYNITHNIWATLTVEDIRHSDVNMAFLPYHHTFGSTGQSMMSAAGLTTVYCDGLKYVQKNLIEYKVSFFFCVPLLIEAIYKKIMAEVAKQGKMKQLKAAIKLSKFMLKFNIDLRKKLFAEILDKLGGSMRFLVSGASAIDPKVAEAFHDFGITVVQGYGLTEASPVICAENSWFYNFHSIGGAIQSVEVMIENPDSEGIGELITRSDSVMLGYYENEEATNEMIVDGWLHTGDLASISEDGKVVIRGRKKNVIVLKNGKNVYPEEIEILVNNLPYVKECLVYGEAKRNAPDNKDMQIALRVVYDSEKYPNGIEDKLRKDIEKINSDLPPYKRIHRVHTTTKEMEKTTTGKIKRYKQTVNEEN